MPNGLRCVFLKLRKALLYTRALFEDQGNLATHQQGSRDEISLLFSVFFS